MRRAASLLSVPTALLASACAPPATTMPPSQAVQNWDEYPLPTEAVILPAAGVGPRWLLPASSPWAAYQKATLLTALGNEKIADLPDTSEIPVVQRAQEAARAVASVGLPPAAMWVVDLRGAASVAFASTLSELSPQPIAPILTFNNWPAENEVVPAEETLAALVEMQPRGPTGDEAAVPVFLLDAWRLAYSELETNATAIDNRYMLTPSDLPDAMTLMSRGITQVLYVVDDLRLTTTEEDDLQQTFLAYQSAGIQVAMVDLPWLTALGQPARWDERVVPRMIVIDPARITICADPRFYRRAHGGFGGVHAICGIHGLGFHRPGWAAFGGPGGGRGG